MTDVERELYELRQELVRLKDELRSVDIKIQFHNYIFSNIGLNVDTISRFENRIDYYRKIYESELSSNHVATKEETIIKFQNVISDYAINLVKGNTGINYERYESILEDYGMSDERCPDILLCKNCKSIKSDHQFNMGLLVPIMGLKRDKKHHCLIKGNNYSFQYYVKYTKDKLYDLKENCLIEELYKNAKFVEEVRKDYCNPSAHTGRLEKTICAECLNYVIDTEKNLKRMLEHMTKRNKE